MWHWQVHWFVCLLILIYPRFMLKKFEHPFVDPAISVNYVVISWTLLLLDSFGLGNVVHWFYVIKGETWNQVEYLPLLHFILNVSRTIVYFVICPVPQVIENWLLRIKNWSWGNEIARIQKMSVVSALWLMQLNISDQ